MGFEERLKAFSAASSGTAKKPESTEFQDRLQRFSDDSRPTQTTGTVPVKTAPVQKSPVLPTKYRTLSGGYTYDTTPAASPTAAHTSGKLQNTAQTEAQRQLDALRQRYIEYVNIPDEQRDLGWVARSKVMEKQIADAEARVRDMGGDPRTVSQREGDVFRSLFTGTAKSYAGQQMTTLGSIGEAERQSGYAQSQLAQAQEAAARYKAEMDATDDSDPAWWAAKTQYDQAAERVRVLQEQVEGYGRADRLLETGYELTQQGEAEKQFGRDSGVLDIQIGNFDVDDALFNAASMGIEQGLDFAAGLVLPGKMTAFFSRAYGGAYQKARSEGATPQQASIYAGSVGAVEVLTEKLSNITLPQKAVYGGGAIDDVIEKAVMSFANRFSTAAGQNVAYYLGKLTAGGFGEFVEELIGNLAEWQLPRIYDGDVESGSEALAGAVEEGLTAAISAIFGGAADLNNYSYSGSDQQIQFIVNEAIRKYGVTEETVDDRTAGDTADVAQEAPANANVTLAALAREMTEESEERPETSAPRPTLATTATGTQQAGRDTATTETAQRAAETPASDAQTALRESAQRGGMGQHGVEAIGEFYRGGNISTYYGDFARAYTAGREGREIGLGNMAEQGAWNAGRMDALESTRVEKSAPTVEAAPQTEGTGAYRFEIVPGDGGYTLRVTNSESGEVTELSGYATEEEARTDMAEYKSYLASDSVAGYNETTTTEEGVNYVQQNEGRGESAKRNDGVGAGGSGRSLSARARAIREGAAARRRGAENIRAAVAASAESRKVSAREQGISTGTDERSMTLVPASLETREMRDVKQDAARRGYEVRYFTGDILTDSGAKRGAVDQQRKIIWIQADDEDATVSQLWAHEKYHTLPEAVKSTVAKRLLEQHGDEIRRLAAEYVDLYGWTDMDMADVLEEVLADAYAGIDVFDFLTTQEGATRYTEEVREAVGAGENGKTYFSLKRVKPVEPSSSAWERSATFDEVKAAHPTLYDLAADENEVRNPTQVTVTKSTYRKIYNLLRDDGFDGTILDASSGLGAGTEVGRNEFGYDVEDIEPYPDKSYKPMYTDYSTLDKTYDAIISNAVLNVLPQDLRDDLTVKMGEMLKPGGRLFVNVRGNDVLNAKSKVPIDASQMEYFIQDGASYQKGFTPKELKAYLEDALGDDFTVQLTTKFGKVSAIVTRKGRTDFSSKPVRDSDGRKLTTEQQAYFADSKARDADGNLLTLYHGTTVYGEITKFKKGTHGWLGPGIYVTTRQSDAQRYADAYGPGNGTVYELYANVTNPLVVMSSNPVPDILRAAYGKDSVYQARSAKQANDPNIITPNDIKKLQAKGYDGIRWDYGRSTEISVFASEQLKRTDNKAPTGSPDTRFSSKITGRQDADYLAAVERGDMDEAQRMVDEAAKAAGYTIKAWHGSRAQFNVFSAEKRGTSTNTQSSKRWFFAGDYETANSYYPLGVMTELARLHPEMFGQKDIESMKRRGVGGKLYSLFIKMTNPLEIDVSGYDYAAHRENADAMMEYIKQAEDENRDGLILYHVRDNNLRPEEENSTDYLFRDPEQAKSADPVTYDDNGNVIPLSERFNAENQDIRFSGKLPVEVKDRFIALHNMSPEAVRGALELGGMAMPSVAMVPSTAGHDTYGEISAVFRKESVSPTDRRNRIFSGDAYTPTFPEVGIKISEKAADKAEKKVKALLKDAGVEGEFSLALDTDNLRDQIGRWGSLEKAYGKNTEYKLAFLQDTGRSVTIPRMEKVYTNRADIATLRKLARKIDLESIYNGDGPMRYEPIVRRLVREYAVKKYGHEVADKLRPADKALSYSDVDNVIHAARELQYSGQTRQVDKAKLEKRIDIAMRAKKVQEEYSEWMQELGKDMVEKRGIRNNRDFFDRYGNRRSFEQLYYDYTLANIVKAMQGERQQGKNTFLTGSGNIRGASAKSYESIEDARKDIGRIRNMALDEAAAPEIQEFDRKTLDLCNRMVEGRGHNKYTGPWDAAEVLTETLSQYKTADQIYRYWKREYGDGGYYNLTREIAEEAAALVKEAQQLPTSYLEAKLYRAVPLEEPLAWVVPNNEKELIQEMRDAGLNVVTYKHGDSADRLKKVNSIPGAQFSSKLTTENELRRQNERLQEQLAAAKKQTEHTVHPEPRKADVEAVARGIVKRYGSSIKGTDISADVGELASDIFSGDTTFVGVKEKAAQIAREIVDNAEELKSPDMESYQQIRAQLRQPIIISEQDAHDVSPEWGAWRRAHRGRVNVSINGNGTPVDVMYAQLSEAYPGYFPDSITYPADQVLQMVNVMDTLAPVMENPFSYYMAEAIEYCANDLIVSIVNDVDSAAPTFADRANQKLIVAKAHGKVALDNLRAEKNAKIAEVQKKNAWATAQALAQVRAQRDKQIQAIKEAYAESRKAASERRADSAARSRLLRIARRLQNQKLPAVTRALLQQYIGELDTVSKSITDKSIIKLSELRDWYMDQKENNPDFISDPGIEKSLQQLSKTQIKDLTSTQVAELTEVLLNIENEIRTQRQLIDSEDKRDTYAQGAQVIEDLKQVKGSDPRGIAGIIDRYILDESLSPVRFMRRLVGWNESDPLLKLTDALADGQRKMFDFQMRAKNLFTKWTEDKALTKRIAGKHAQEIAISGMSANGPVTVKITPAMRMSLYLHSLNDQNLKHIAGGGIKIPDMQLYKAGKIAEAFSRGMVIRLTPSEVRKIAGGMTAEERAFARAAHAYFNGMSQQEINAVSEKLKGYSLAQVENYFPINTDTKFTKKDFDSLKFDGTIEGMGFLKERVNAAGPIILRDMTDVLNQSIDNTAKYVGLAIPVRNFNKVWGVTKRSFNADGTRSGADSAVQEAVANTWGESGYKYIEKMMKDLQSGGRDVEQWDKLFNRIRSNYAGAVLTLNLSVAMKQMASYPTAGAVVGFGPLARAMADIGKVDLNLIAKYTPLQWYRSQGFSTQELGDLSNRGIKLPPALNWVQGADLLTTRKLWKAAEYYVRANNKGLEGDAYYKAVAEVYNRIIEETQPNYTTMQRPQLLRSDSTLLQNLAMFKTQPFQNFNILYDAYGNLRAKRAAYMNAENKAEAKAAYQQAQKQARWATGSQIVQLAVFAGMTFAWNLLRGKLDKYKDDDDEVTVKSVLGGILKDMLSGAAAQVPFGADAYEAINSIVTGEKYYGMDAVAPSAISDFMTELVSASSDIKDVVADLSNPDADVNWDKLRKKLDKFLKAGSKILGVPFENVENIFNMAYQRAAQAAAGKYVGQYAYLQLTTDLSTSNGKGKAYDLLYGAMQHNYSQYQELYRAMLDDGFEEKTIKTAMENRMKEAYGVSSVKDLDERWEAP